MSAPTFSVTINSQLTIVETIVGGGISGSDATVTKNGYNETVVATASTTPPVTKATGFDLALSGGTGTIDLTALPGLTPSETIDCTGLKLTCLKLLNPATNANKITVAKGASNGFQIDGATTWSFVLAPGQSILVNADGASDTVGSTKRTIDVTGTGSQVLNVVAALG